MQILHKKAGQFYGEADTLASPPGHVFVGDERYGQWMGKGDAGLWNGRLISKSLHCTAYG